MVNPLDPIVQWHRTANDSLRVTRRVLTQKIGNAVTSRHVFSGMPLAESLARLDEAKEELERLIVLALAAVFERTLRDHLTQIPRTAISTGDSLREAVREELVKDIEFWNISDRVLGVFPTVDPLVRGQVKQVIQYRNWVAHGHMLALPPPVNLLPQTAYQWLTGFLVQAGVV